MALSFAIKLTDQVSPDARKAAGALQALHTQITAEGAALKSLENQMRTLEKGGAQNLDLYKRMTGALGEQRNKVANLTAEMVKSGGAGFVPAKANAVALNSLLESLAGKSGSAGEALAALGPEGVAAAAGLGAVAVGGTAVIAALIGVAGAVVYLETQLVKMGIAASEAKGDVTRSLELLYGSQKAAEHTYKVLESITGDIAISQDRVMDLADHLIKAGQVNGDAMIRSIETIGKAEAVRKDAGKVLEGVITRATTNRIFSVSRQELMAVGLTYKELSREVAKGIGTTTGEAELRLRTGGVRVKEGLEALGRVVDTKMGGLAMQKFETVSVQTQRLHDNFMRLFEGVNAGPFARLIMVIANQLDESSVTGAALRAVLKSAFDEISSAAETAGPYIQALFEGGILMALKFYNALFPVRRALKGLFGGSATGGLESFEDKTIAFANSVGVGFQLAASAVAFLIDHIKQLGAIVDTVAHLTPFVGAALDLAKLNIDVLTGKFDKAKGSGKAAADGVVAGVQAGTPAVEKAMGDMATKGLKSFDDKLQIHSPSKVMQLRGQYLNLGLAKGVNDNADEPAKAMSKVGDGIGSAPIGGGKSGSGVTVQVTFAAGAVVVGGNAGVSDIQDQLTDLMAEVFQKAAAMQGAA